MKPIRWKSFLIQEGIVLAAAGISSLLIAGSVGYYAQVKLPPLAPPSILFPIVWSLLYFCMGISAYWIQNSGATSLMKQTAFFWYGLQLFVNVLWPVFFFLFRFYGFSFIWLCLLWLLIFQTIRSFREISAKAAYLQIPYLLWVTFAGYLNLGVWILN